MNNDKSGNTKDGEFKISLSVEDIDKIDDEIKSMEDGTKKILDESNTAKIEESIMVEKQKDHNVVNGITLLNTCMICNNKFKPVNSMINETSCTLCSKKNS